MNEKQFHNFHPDKISLVNIEPMNKSSSLFLYTLFDGHPELISGFIEMGIYPEVSSNLTLEQITKYSYDLLHDNIWERITPYKFPFSIKEFSHFFQNYLRKFGISNKNCFIAIHYAISLLLKKDVSKIKWIVLYTHGSIKSILRAKQDFPDSKIILTIRDPRASAWSFKRALANVPAYLTVTYAPLWLKNFKNIYRKCDILFIKHEELHADYNSVRYYICSFLTIKDNKSFDKATYFDNLWDGSAKNLILSTKNILSVSPNKQFIDNDWKVGLNRFELFVINKFLGKQVIQEFDYPSFYKKRGGIYIPINILIRLERRLGNSGVKKNIVKSYQFFEKLPVISNFFQLFSHIAFIYVSITWFLKDWYHFKKYLPTKRN